VDLKIKGKNHEPPLKVGIDTLIYSVDIFAGSGINLAILSLKVLVHFVQLSKLESSFKVKPCSFGSLLYSGP